MWRSYPDFGLDESVGLLLNRSDEPERVKLD
jgi:hypothetical protein